jgi:hypothetical protein
MAAKHSDTPKIVGDGKDIVCFLLGGSWYTRMGFYFIFILHFSIYFFLQPALSAAQLAKSVGEIIENGLGRQGESWSDSPDLAAWEMAPSSRRAVFYSPLGPGLDDARTQSSPYRSTPSLELALCGQSLYYFIGFGKFQSITIAALFCVKRSILSNFLIYSFLLINVTKAIDCTSNGGSHPLHSLCRTRGAH